MADQVIIETVVCNSIILGLLVCFITMAMFMKFEPHHSAKDNKLSQVCQVSLFFSLTASIALKTERDSSANALAVILVIFLAVPPVLTFIFQSDLDFEQGCRISAISSAAQRTFQATVGKCLVWLLGTPERSALLRKPHLDDESGLAAIELSAV